MEAALRTAYKVVTGADMPHLEYEPARGLGGLKEATVFLMTEDDNGMDLEVKIAIVNGLGNSKELVQAIKDGWAKYDFVEVMACPGGCIGGGGQPKSTDKDILNKRLAGIYELHKTFPVRQSHENPIVRTSYDKFLSAYGSPVAHELLHIKPVYGREMKPKTKKEKTPKDKT